VRWFWLSVVAIVVGGLIFAGISRKRKFENSEKIEVVGDIVRIRPSHRLSIKASYKVYDEIYFQTENDGQLAGDLYEGEKFMIAYVPDDPTLSEILLNKPYIPEADDLYGHTVSTNDIKYIALRQDLIEFSYNVKGKNYTRLQRVKDFQGKDAIKGRSFDVIYFKSQPSIAYICLDKNNCWQGPHITVPVK